MWKVILLLSVIASVLTFVECPDLRAQSNAFYADLGIGAEIPIHGYKNLDNRFAWQAEAGNNYFAVPITYSPFGQDTQIFSLAPRAQYYFYPSEDFPKLSLAPGVGPVMNVWWTDVSGTSTSEKDLEFGAELSAHFRYEVTDHINVILTPVAVDLDFWRKTWFSPPIGTVSSQSNSNFRAFFNFSVLCGYTF